MSIFADSGAWDLRVKLVKLKEALLTSIALFFYMLHDVKTVLADFVFSFVMLPKASTTGSG